ncbi:MAG: hypothetical protein ACAF42_04385 [Limnothrix sp. BL-A-16]
MPASGTGRSQQSFTIELGAQARFWPCRLSENRGISQRAKPRDRGRILDLHPSAFAFRQDFCGLTQPLREAWGKGPLIA